MTLDDQPEFNATVSVIQYCDEIPSKGWDVTGSLVQWKIKNTVLDEVTITLSDKKLEGSGDSKEWTFTARATVSVGNMDQVGGSLRTRTRPTLNLLLLLLLLRVSI